MSTLASTAVPNDSTIPAIPLIVSAAWKDVKIPKVKKMLTIRAQLAIMPGMKSYTRTM